MTALLADDRRADLIGSLWMITAMASFAIEDTFIKTAGASLPIAQILVIFGLGGSLVFAAVARLQGEPLFVPDVLSPPMRVRVVFEIAGRLFYTLAITLTPLSVATVVLQATPLVVVAGAALVFGETVGWRRWTAIFIGLLGVVVIVQPGAESFSPLTIFAILGMLGFAGRDLASRAAPRTISTTLLGLYGFLTMLVAGVVVGLWMGQPFVWPSLPVALAMLGAIIFGTTAYSCLMKAMRTGAVSAVTPFRYTRLLFGIALGLLIFQEALTLPMIVGSCLILSSGLFILWRGKRVSG